MTYNEVMINDWVLDASTGDPVRFEIPTFITNPTRLICNCKPIPLTAEILEKNNAIQIDERRKLLGYAVIEPNEDKWHFSYMANYENVVGINFTYVHQLQHALRLCGLTDLADNFGL